MTTPDPILYRRATPDDLKFILSSWVRSYCRHGKGESLLRKLFVDAVRGTIGDILQQPTTRIVVACNRLDPNIIFGWACYDVAHEFPVLHYVYVKELFRGGDIGSTLVKQARAGKPGVMRYTFRTKAGERLLPEAQFDQRLVTRSQARTA